MNSLRLKNGYEIQIEDGASLFCIEHIAQTEEAALEVINQLTAENVSAVEFLHDGVVNGEYPQTALNTAPTRAVNEDGTITVTISLREKTDLELRVDALEESQSIQDGAIEDLGTAVSDMMEG